jgi:glycosyltransferase involved in cell wall biosynthesis
MTQSKQKKHSLLSPSKLASRQNQVKPEIIYFQELIESCELSSIIFVDITDYVIFFVNRANVSGIQRVVHSLLKYFDITAFPSGIRLCYCMIHPSTGQYANVHPLALASLFEAVDEGGSPQLINKLAREMLDNSIFYNYVPFKRLDVLIILGGPWATPTQLNLYCLEKDRIRFRAYCVCYDLIPIDFPEFCASGLSQVFQQAYHKLSYLCNGFISISQYTNECIREYELRLGINRPESAYESWRLGDFDSSFDLIPSQLPLDINQAVCREIKEFGFVLVVSTIEPRKNHQSMLRAWRLLESNRKSRERPLPVLIFAGKIGWNSNDLVEQVRCLNNSGIRIHILEGLSDKTIAWLYANCLFSVMPSFVEGWGLSIPESMMRGKVCLTASSSSMVEASSGIAPLFDPYNARELYKALQSFIYDGGLKPHQNKLQEYKAVSWQESSIEFYGKLAKMQSSPLVLNQPFITDSIYPLMHLPGFNPEFEPSKHTQKLAMYPCWLPLTGGNNELAPFSWSSTLSFELDHAPYIIKIYIKMANRNSILPSVKVSHHHSMNIACQEDFLCIHEDEYICYIFSAEQADNMSPHKLVISFDGLKTSLGSRDQSIIPPEVKPVFSISKIHFLSRSQ